MTTMTSPTNYSTKQKLFNRLARAVSPLPGYVTEIKIDPSGNFSTVNMSGLKRCTLCNFTKPVEDFYKNGKSPDGIETACKDCRDSQ